MTAQSPPESGWVAAAFTGVVPPARRGAARRCEPDKHLEVVWAPLREFTIRVPKLAAALAGTLAAAETEEQDESTFVDMPIAHYVAAVVSASASGTEVSVPTFEDGEFGEHDASALLLMLRKGVWMYRGHPIDEMTSRSLERVLLC
jgi:hypothetical protein